ncbi:hypothetical protein [Wenyingzhuangia aestuarii]|uniref:hypothetical protein n=1 Tax=Wenyingzhuangia aestuarii TaxID=1647582 RepID=UPI00143A91B7|nr:hypothetical protein [Wenyingzhuangia aestuarii]NJB82800.1 hypothetical protein [Wenyingzhuangia aestuarii]
MKKNEMKIVKKRIFKRITFLLSLILFLTSLSQNTFLVTNGRESIGSFGLMAFLFGWMNIYGAGISWIANPLLLSSWITLFTKKWKLPMILSFLAMLFSLSFLLFHEVVTNEGGGKSRIIAYDFGYKLWLSSCIINFFGNLIIHSAEVKILKSKKI